ncbi:trypsin-like peptidase domain-containing protein [Sulfurimonas sp. SAG-AH-194-L11]|nr:serine protease [Sulfurimonas sp. SAG-AH-194-L11]MDF1877801.1 trypsin-like peptidase domain-containing protein [Sulfurimonas sp. SAG-AH-194-L11]
MNFLKYIRGEEDEIFIKLAKRFNTLFIRDHSSFTKIKNVNKLTYHDINNFDEKVFIIEYTHSDGNESTGSAFILHNYPYLITCSHVVGEVKGNNFFHDGSITIINYKHQKEKVKLITKCDHHDIAILELPNFLKNKYTLYNASLNQHYFSNLKLSTSIKYLGFPNYKFPDEYSMTEANITSMKTSSLREYIEVDKTIKSGNSGGPAIFKNKVIGLCTNGDHTMGSMPNRILSVKHIIKLLDSI